MYENCRTVAAVAGLLLSIFITDAAFAQKQGGTLKMRHWDSPGSASIHEESTVSTNVPFMGVFNNLVIYKQDVAQNSPESIVPDLSTSWSWRGPHEAQLQVA
jgi:peptide/nickel transport system substrate-binding protein